MAAKSEQAEHSFLLFSNHPVAGLRYRSKHKTEDEAREAATFEEIPDGRNPEEYEFVIVQGYVVEKGGNK